MCRWLLVVKDHFTRLVHLAPLCHKKAHEVAFECDPCFSLVGHPIVFQTDNGTEFQSQVLQKMKELNPSCSCVTGRPRTPRDQGSVERANSGIKEIISKMVQHTKSETQDPEEKEKVTWVSVLGVAQRSMNTNRQKGKNQVEPHEMVFGIKCD